MISVAEKQRY